MVDARVFSAGHSFGSAHPQLSDSFKATLLGNAAGSALSRPQPTMMLTSSSSTLPESRPGTSGQANRNGVHLDRPIDGKRSVVIDSECFVTSKY